MREARTMELGVESIYGVQTQQPLVQLTWGEAKGMLSVEQARELAMWLWECSEAAITDAMLFEWSRQQELGEQGGAALVHLLRGYRAARAERNGK